MALSSVVRQAVRRQDACVGDIVNLRRAKKQRERRKANVLAQQNRVRHGRTAAEKASHRRTEQQRQALLDASLRCEPRE